MPSCTPRSYSTITQTWPPTPILPRQDHADLAPDADLAQATLPVPARAGVCLFVDSADRPILLLYGAGLRAIVRHRLTEPPDTEKTRRLQLRPITARLWFRRTYSPFETELTYFHLARALYPDTYRSFFPRLNIYFLQLDPTEPLPVFRRTDRLPAGPHRYWGPFGDQASLDRFIETIQDLFDLCRCPERLADAPHADACPYAQMNRCGAVCDGTLAPDQYRQLINRATNLLDAEQNQTITDWHQQMKRAAADRQYEHAQTLKTRIEQAQKLTGPAYRWVAPIHRFYVYAFQPGPSAKVEGRRAAQPTVSPFLIGPGWITQIEPFTLDDAPAACRHLIDHCQLLRFQNTTSDNSNAQPELLAWAAHFLYRTARDQGLYVRTDNPQTAADPDQLAQLVTKHFARPEKKPTQKPQLDTLSISQSPQNPHEPEKSNTENTRQTENNQSK